MADIAAHTAGPWSYSQESIDPEWYIVTIKGGMIVANVNAHFHQEANARLIAAAPDMRAALIEAKQEMWLGARHAWTMADFKNWAVIQKIDAALEMADGMLRTQPHGAPDER